MPYKALCVVLRQASMDSPLLRISYRNSPRDRNKLHADDDRPCGTLGLSTISLSSRANLL
ncbi:hypothetical protein G9C98_001359 [Cotesia typhae]|uniref:Uncharacterized protein n=1 Tax=Cotesia typhae TaxID=2053667 RepID=A0A8J5USS9_9HYME|nr:hypothetical protein G9C98_001359 [Cotesia typhae]